MLTILLLLAEELASITFWSCSLCSKYISTEASGLGGTYKTESCGHQFCKDCHTNLVNKILQGVESESPSWDRVNTSLKCLVDT
jgi:hypothetical protein